MTRFSRQRRCLYLKRTQHSSKNLLMVRISGQTCSQSMRNHQIQNSRVPPSVCPKCATAGKAFDDIPDQGPESLTHLGFIRCGMDGPELTEADKTKLRSMAHGQPVIAVVVTYPAPQLVWLWDTNINCMNILRAMSYRVLPYEM